MLCQNKEKSKKAFTNYNFLAFKNSMLIISNQNNKYRKIETYTLISRKTNKREKFYKIYFPQDQTEKDMVSRKLRQNWNFVLVVM